MTSIGIDFGTTNSVAALYGPTGAEVISIGEPPAAWADLGFDRVLPSIVAIDDNRRLTFGWEAKTSSTGQRFEAIKRLFKEEEIATAGNEEFFVEEIAASIFRHIRSRVVANGIDFTSAVITVPANSRGLARYRTKVCAGLGEIEPLALLNEPTAAAMAYTKRQLVDDQTILVFDLGGGTLDVTVLESKDGMFFEQASKGIPQLGGMDFDSAILRAIAEDYSGSDSWNAMDKSRIRLLVEEAKIRLSTTNDEWTIVDPEALPGYRLTLPRFNDITRHLVERSGTAVEAVLRDLRMGPADVDVLLLVGGSSKIPAVRQFVSELVGREPATGIDPMTAVGEGAAVAAAILDGRLEDNDFFVSTEHALGTIAVDPREARLHFSPVIPRNQKLPARQTEAFSPIFDYQESVRVIVIEGDPALPVEHPDNQILTEFEVPIDPPRPASEAGFELTYAYDREGLLHVDVVDMMTGNRMTDSVTVSFKGAREGHDLVGMAGRVRTMVDSGAAASPQTDSSSGSSSVDPKSRELLSKARTKVIPFLEEEEAQAIADLARQLETSTGDVVPQAQEALEEALRKYSYLF